MAPHPTLLKAREAGQTTIFGIDGTLSIRPPPPRPSRLANSTPNIRLETVLGRRLLGGPNQLRIKKLFVEYRLAETDGVSKVSDLETTNRGNRDTIDYNAKVDEEEEWHLRQRMAYTREHKLAAIEFCQTT